MINVESPEYEEYIYVLKKRIEEDTNVDALTAEAIRKIIDENQFIKMAGFEAEKREAIARYFEQRFQTVQNSNTAQIQAKNYKPWLQERKKTLDFYWPRFKDYCSKDENLPVAVVKSLDETSDKILDYAGDPKVEGQFQRRGMVIGHVQSGKTLN